MLINKSRNIAKLLLHSDSMPSQLLCAIFNFFIFGLYWARQSQHMRTGSAFPRHVKLKLGTYTMGELRLRASTRSREFGAF